MIAHTMKRSYESLQVSYVLVWPGIVENREGWLKFCLSGGVKRNTFCYLGDGIFKEHRVGIDAS